MTAAEGNDRYRAMMRDVLEFDPQILKRFVNFMNNPDEETAATQFGKGDKYFGVSTLLATLPGLPMFGHGQIEGLTEKYGMEYRRARWDEEPDRDLIERHRREIFPLLHRRRQFAEAADFLLYDFVTDGEGTDENVYAYSNLVDGDASLVIFNNAYNETEGSVRRSVAYRDKTAGTMGTRTLAEGLGLSGGHDRFVIMREHVSGLEHLGRADRIAEDGLRIGLHAYERRVYLDIREVCDESGALEVLAGRLGGAGVRSIEAALEDLRTEPLQEAFAELAGASGPLQKGKAADPGRRAEALESLLEEADDLGLDLDANAVGFDFSRDLNRLSEFVAALPVEREPLLDQEWLGAWAAWRALGGAESPLSLGRLPFEGAERWSVVLPIVERHSDEIGIWSRTRGAAGPLRRLFGLLLKDPDVRTVLQVHEHREVNWFDRDGFRTLSRAIVGAALLGSTRAGRHRAAELQAALGRAEERSGYRLDRLLNAPQER